MQDAFGDGVAIMFGEYENDYASIVLADNPLNYWKLGESSGSVADSGSDGTKTGTANGAVTYNLPGGLFADDSTAIGINDASTYIDVGTIGTNPLNSFSAEGWMFLDSF